MHTDELRQISHDNRPSVPSTLLPGLTILASLAFGQCAFVHLPADTIVGHRIGETLAVPIYITGHGGLGVISADIGLFFVPDTALVATDYCQVGGAAQGWMALANPQPGGLLIAMAGADTLRSDTLLVTFKVVIAESCTAWIHFNRCDLNEGTVPCSTSGGIVPITEPPLKPVTLSELSIRPNPTRHGAVLDYDLALPGRVSIAVLDARGQVVRMLVTELQMAGRHRFNWNRRDDRGTRLPAGVYFLTLDAPGAHEARKLILAE